MTYKIKISKPTFNVLTETAPDNLIFSSDYNTLKYYTSGDIAVVVNYANYYLVQEISPQGTFYKHRKEETVAHNLGYIPYFTSYIKGYAGPERYNMCPGTVADVVFYSYALSYADATNIYFAIEMRNQTSSGTIQWDFAYKVFKNKTNL